MPVLLVPILWAGGALIVLGGGYYALACLATKVAMADWSILSLS